MKQGTGRFQRLVSRNGAAAQFASDFFVGRGAGTDRIGSRWRDSNSARLCHSARHHGKLDAHRSALLRISQRVLRGHADARNAISSKSIKKLKKNPSCFNRILNFNQPPNPRTPYDENEIVNATMNNLGCPQPFGQEDCLSLNIFTPNVFKLKTRL